MSPTSQFDLVLAEVRRQGEAIREIVGEFREHAKDCAKKSGDMNQAIERRHAENQTKWDELNRKMLYAALTLVGIFASILYDLVIVPRLSAPVVTIQAPQQALDSTTTTTTTSHRAKK